MMRDLSKTVTHKQPATLIMQRIRMRFLSFIGIFFKVIYLCCQALWKWTETLIAEYSADLKET